MIGIIYDNNISKNASASALKTPELWLGTSGWHYDHWRQVFYPPHLGPQNWLKFYAQYFSTVELNVTFYRLPSVQVFGEWYRQTPPNFRFSVKCNRLITHLYKLHNVQDALANFLERVSVMAEKLGPLLYQLPFSFQQDEHRLKTFLKLLPSGYQHVIEFRHPSWYRESVYRQLQHYDVALCLHDYGGQMHPWLLCADFAYLRLHGAPGNQDGAYSEEALAAWCRKIQAIAQTTPTAYIYFNNDAGGSAIANAQTLMQLLSI